VFKHGGYGTRLYRIWYNMKARCYNPNCNNYPRYGERGIDVCCTWRDDFSAFREWAIENGYSEGLTLDRIDNDKGYSPENCRWATQKEQNRNRRDNRLVALNGEPKPIAEWAEIYGIKKATLHKRVVILGWTLEKSLSTPPWGDPDREPNWSQMKAVQQCDKDGNILATFGSVAEASRVTEISRCNISSVLHGKRKIAGGYYWKFATEGGMNIEFVRNK